MLRGEPPGRILIIVMIPGRGRCPGRRGMRPSRTRQRQLVPLMVSVTCEPGARTSWRPSRQKACCQPGNASIQVSTRGPVVSAIASAACQHRQGQAGRALARRESMAHGSGKHVNAAHLASAIRRPSGYGGEFAGRGAAVCEPGDAAHNRRIRAQITSQSGRPPRANNRRSEIVRAKDKVSVLSGA